MPAGSLKASSGVGIEMLTVDAGLTQPPEQDTYD